MVTNYICTVCFSDADIVMGRGTLTSVNEGKDKELLPICRPCLKVRMPLSYYQISLSTNHSRNGITSARKERNFNMLPWRRYSRDFKISVIAYTQLGTRYI